MWPVLEMGSHSVMPSTMPMSTAFKISTINLHSLSRRGAGDSKDETETVQYSYERAAGNHSSPPEKAPPPVREKNLLMKTGSHKTIPSIPQSAEKQKARRAENRAFGAKPAQKGRFTCQAEQIGYNVKQNAAPG